MSAIRIALDALESTKALPTASILWRKLYQHVQALEAGDKAQLIAAIVAYQPDEPAADWLRLSALHYLTGEMNWIARQSRLASRQTAIDAVVELLDCVWTSVLSKAHSRTELTRLVRDIDLPRLQALAEPEIIDAPATPAAPGAGLRIAVYTPQIANPRHGGTLFTLNIASALSRLSHSIRVFSAQESDIPDRAAYNGASISFKPPTLEPGELTIHARHPVPIVLAGRGMSVRHKMQSILKSILDDRPDVVVFVGFLSPVAYALWKRFPVIGLSTNTLPPVAPVDVWLSARPDEPPPVWTRLPAPAAHGFGFRFWPKGPVAPEKRESLGIPDTAIVLITAGFRLHAECAPPWSDEVLAFLDAHPTVWWILLGVQAERLHPSLAAHPRVRPVPPKRSAAAWYAMSDIYLNPPRIGGGGSVAEAMEQGLPVISHPDCDGGDKIGNMAATSPAAFFSQLACWVIDRDARQAAGRQLKAKFHAELDIAAPAAADALAQAIRVARAAFESRRAPP